jgi:hypothetical protein
MGMGMGSRRINVRLELEEIVKGRGKWKMKEEWFNERKETVYVVKMQPKYKDRLNVRAYVQLEKSDGENQTAR